LKDVGFVFAPVQLPVKPKLTDEPAVTFAFQVRFFAVTAMPDWVTSAFHAWVSFCPSAKDQARDQPLQAAVPVLVSAPSAWKPPDHWLVILYVSVQAPVGGGRQQEPHTLPAHEIGLALAVQLHSGQLLRGGGERHVLDSARHRPDRDPPLGHLPGQHPVVVRLRALRPENDRLLVGFPASHVFLITCWAACAPSPHRALISPYTCSRSAKLRFTPFSNATSPAQVAASLHACRVASSAAAWRGVGSSLTCTVSFTITERTTCARHHHTFGADHRSREVNRHTPRLHRPDTPADHTATTPRRCVVGAFRSDAALHAALLRMRFLPGVNAWGSSQESC
jgi:hypothetical protein